MDGKAADGIFRVWFIAINDTRPSPHNSLQYLQRKLWVQEKKKTLCTFNNIGISVNTLASQSFRDKKNFRDFKNLF